MKSIIPSTNHTGEPRKIGYELEFSGLKLEQAAKLIQSLYGGSVSRKHRYRYDVVDTSYGAFRVELDARNLRRMARENAFKSWGIDFDEEQETNSIEDIVDRLAQTVVPLEIVMPPVSMDAIDEFEQLRAVLQENKAEGTKSSLVHAFGMHINIECPDLEADSLLRYLRAFLILYPWLLKKHKIDLTRKMTRFVDRFPEPYVRLVLNPEYKPAKQQLISDYLQHNPTRNRPLDMMPIWALDLPDKVEEVLEEEKNSPRPTFHYRLPNSHVDDSGWQLGDELACWMEVELLANRPDMVNKLSRLYLVQSKRRLSLSQQNWIETLTILLELDE